MAMSESAKAAKAAYNKKWKKEHPDKVRAYKRKWQQENPEKVKAMLDRYWEKKAAEKAAERAAEQKAAEQP